MTDQNKMNPLEDKLRHEIKTKAEGFKDYEKRVEEMLETKGINIDDIHPTWTCCKCGYNHVDKTSTRFLDIYICRPIHGECPRCGGQCEFNLNIEDVDLVFSKWSSYIYPCSRCDFVGELNAFSSGNCYGPCPVCGSKRIPKTGRFVYKVVKHKFIPFLKSKKFLRVEYHR